MGACGAGASLRPQGPKRGADLDQAQARRPDRGGIVIAVLLLAMAGVIAWDTVNLQIGAVYGLGPKAMPMVVASGLAVLAVGNFILALRGEFPEREPADPTAILRILGGLAALIAVIGFGGGFIPATTLLFAMTAAGFGRRAFGADLAIGFVLSVVIYLLFAKLLTLSLPIGPLERLM
jgi:putative tricarboxylic transport membrane protein